MPNDEHPEGTLLIDCDCGVQFPFTPGEQKFYAERGLFPPKRCPMCRLKRKQKFQKKDQNNE